MGLWELRCLTLEAQYWSSVRFKKVLGLMHTVSPIRWSRVREAGSVLENTLSTGG